MQNSLNQTIMKKILFPTDFSEISKNAFLFALHLAKSIQAEIITLHVYEYPAMNYMDVPVYLPEIYEVTELSNFENYKGHIPVLRAIAEQNNLDHVKISNVLESGDLIANIVEISKKENIDYIVMGTKGATGLAETFLGSVTEKVMNNTNAVVLAIPQHCQYKPIKRILFTTEYKTEEIEVLKRTVVLAKVFHAHIDCLYVKPAKDYVDDVIVNDWKKMFSTEDLTFHNIGSNDSEGTILDFISNHNIDMLSMTTHHRNFFEKLFQISLSKKLVFHAKIPVLALHT
jgi:nucleotide-binding universal stress UspA family protein